jgi:hypothetical protein
MPSVTHGIVTTNGFDDVKPTTRIYTHHQSNPNATNDAVSTDLYHSYNNASTILKTEPEDPVELALGNGNPLPSDPEER